MRNYIPFMEQTGTLGDKIFLIISLIMASTILVIVVAIIGKMVLSLCRLCNNTELVF